MILQINEKISKINTKIDVCNKFLCVDDDSLAAVLFEKKYSIKNDDINIKNKNEIIQLMSDINVFSEQNSN